MKPRLFLQSGLFCVDFVGWANGSIVCPRRVIIGGQAKRRLPTLPDCSIPSAPDPTVRAITTIHEPFINMNNKRHMGVVKLVDSPEEGVGFIILTTVHGTKDIPFDIECNGHLDENDKVTFIIVKGRKGFEAQDISKYVIN